jgi:ubiquinone/menaquinone biosynthesis C-methylase UbiE
VSASDPDTQRLEMLDRWGRAAAGWRKRADAVREHGMPVSLAMIEHLGLRSGQRVLELAAGPGDTGFLAAELIRPGGILVCSDASAPMLDVARARASELGVENVEFMQLELEWIDLPTASVDAVLCRWGVMLILDPAAALREARRVLRPGGRIALAVWDQSSLNPWATIPSRALITLGHASHPDQDAPGMFALAAPGRLQELLESTGFVEVIVEAVELERSNSSLDAFVEETLDLSRTFAEVFERLTEGERAEVEREIASLAAPFVSPEGSVSLPGSSLVAAAGA